MSKTGPREGPRAPQAGTLKVGKVSIGAHVSTEGRLSKAIERAKALGCDCVQIFFGAPVAWARPKYSDEQVEAYRRRSEELGVSPTVVHAMYLINLASKDRAMRAKSVRALADTLAFGERIGAIGVVLHPGSHQGRGFEWALPQVAASIREALRRSPGRCSIFVECSAGGGGSVARSFEEIAQLISAVENGRRARIGVCLDLAHLHGAGYDVVSQAGVSRTFRAFGRTVGWDRLGVIHANDSKVERGSKMDRHQNVGRGHIGNAGFLRMLALPALRRVPWILEVPGLKHEGPDRSNVLHLRRLSVKAARSRQ